MKKLVYLAVFCLFISCKKTETKSTGITGQWEWYKASGGIGGIEQTPQSTGQSWQLKLNADFSATQTGNLVPAGTGSYTLTEETSNGSTRELLNLTINGETTTFAWSFVSPDSLQLDDHIEVDGLSYFLVRE